MRPARRIAAPGFVLFLIVVFFWTYSLDFHLPVTVQSHGKSHNWPSAEDKIVVIAKTETEDTDWVMENLTDWQHAIYHMEDPQAKFHVPKNKGRESMAYLTYLIDHYNSLPSTIAFVHSHRDGWPSGWHTDAAGHDNVISLRTVRIQHIQDTGYANLRCLHTPGCPDEIQPFRDPPDPERDVERAISDAWAYIFDNALEVPRVIGVACCSQFAISRTQALSRPVQDYEKLRDWLLQTPLSDHTSGRVTEYLWHILFGRDPVYCPDLAACYCDVYGRC